ncbi:MAG: tetratricopeptide repeat protein [Alphaproteobacteria bacterium]|nr:tetratricopeptide repeat protein [Alphaproteobacteria bacterium]
MNNTSERNLLQEIEEEMRNQKLKAFWARWGVSILAAAALVVLATAAVTFWRSYKTQAAQTLTQAYMLELGQRDISDVMRVESFQAFAQEHPDTIQSTMARFQAAGAATRIGQRDEALKIYDSLVADTSLSRLYRDLAQLLYVQTAFDMADKAELKKRLQPLMKDSPLRFGAQELAAHLALAMDEREKARNLFLALAANPDLPHNLRARVQDMAQWLSGEGDE